MKHTSLFLKLLVATFVVFSFTFVEAVTGRRAGNTRTKTTSTTKNNQQAPPVDQSSNNYSNELRSKSAAPDKCEAMGKPVQACDDKKGFSWDPESCSCVDFGSREWGFTPSEENNNASSSNGNSQNLVGCESTYQKLLTACEQEVINANNSCDNDQDSGIQSAKSQLSDFAVGLGNQVAVNKPCAGIAKYVGALNTAVAGFAVYCSNARDGCMTSCNKVLKELKSEKAAACFMSDVRLMKIETAAEQQFTQCKQLNAKVETAKGAVQNIVQTVKGAQACVDQTATNQTDYCRANPTALGCSKEPVECANPTFAAQNPICFCTGPGAATNPKCRAVGRATSSELGSGSMQIPSSKTGGEPDPTFGSEKEEWKGIADYKPGSNQGEDPGGKKGGRPVEGGSGGSGGGGPGGGAGGGEEAAGGPQINNGFRAGSGGGGGGFGGGGGGSGDGRYANGGQGGGSGASGGPDLRQFLPGGKYAPGSRGVAGLTGPDGITGPHDNLWKKIKNRYQAQQPTFLGY